VIDQSAPLPDDDDDDDMPWPSISFLTMYNQILSLPHFLLLFSNTKYSQYGFREIDNNSDNVNISLIKNESLKKI
jgi:hypothetical protein